MKENNVVVNATKLVYKFKPAFHWNHITKEQYEVLCKFYPEGMIKMEEEE